jgi:hypothetical protein
VPLRFGQLARVRQDCIGLLQACNPAARWSSGAHEALPAAVPGVAPWEARLGRYRRVARLSQQGGSR